jgi:hypothetical protein
MIFSILIALAIAIIATYFLFRDNGKYKLPPRVEGGVPLFGNALQLPPIGHEAGIVVKQWAKKYGEMYLLYSLSSPHPS